MTAIIVMFLRGAAAEAFTRMWRTGDPRSKGYYPLVNAAMAVADNRVGWWGPSRDDRSKDR